MSLWNPKFCKIPNSDIFVSYEISISINKPHCWLAWRADCEQQSLTFIRPILLHVFCPNSTPIALYRYVARALVEEFLAFERHWFSRPPMRKRVKWTRDTTNYRSMLCKTPPTSWSSGYLLHLLRPTIYSKYHMRENP